MNAHLLGRRGGPLSAPPDPRLKRGRPTSHLSSGDRRVQRRGLGLEWSTPPQIVLSDFYREVEAGSAVPLTSTPTGAVLEEPLILLGPTLAAAIQAGRLPESALSNLAYAALAAQHLYEAYPGAFINWHTVHPGCPRRMGVQLAQAATPVGQAAAASLNWSGSVLVPLSLGSAAAEPLNLEVKGTPVLLEPYTVKVAFYNPPGSLAYRGFTNAILVAAGYEPDAGPADLTRPHVVSEFLSDHLGGGGGCLAQMPACKLLVAFVRGPEADPGLSRLPCAFSCSQQTTTIRLSPMTDVPACPAPPMAPPKPPAGAPIPQAADPMDVEPGEVPADTASEGQGPTVATLHTELAALHTLVATQGIQLEHLSGALQEALQLLRAQARADLPTPSPDRAAGPPVLAPSRADIGTQCWRDTLLAQALPAAPVAAPLGGAAASRHQGTLGNPAAEQPAPCAPPCGPPGGPNPPLAADLMAQGERARWWHSLAAKPPAPPVQVGGGVGPGAQPPANAANAAASQQLMASALLAAEQPSTLTGTAAESTAAARSIAADTWRVRPGTRSTAVDLPGTMGRLAAGLWDAAELPAAQESDGAGRTAGEQLGALLRPAGARSALHCMPSGVAAAPLAASALAAGHWGRRTQGTQSPADTAVSWRRPAVESSDAVQPDPPRPPDRSPPWSAPGRGPRSGPCPLDAALAVVDASSRAISSPTPRAGIGHPSRTASAAVEVRGPEGGGTRPLGAVSASAAGPDPHCPPDLAPAQPAGPRHAGSSQGGDARSGRPRLAPASPRPPAGPLPPAGEVPLQRAADHPKLAPWPRSTPLPPPCAAPAAEAEHQEPGEAGNEGVREGSLSGHQAGALGSPGPAQQPPPLGSQRPRRTARGAARGAPQPCTSKLSTPPAAPPVAALLPVPLQATGSRFMPAPPQLQPPQLLRLREACTANLQGRSRPTHPDTERPGLNSLRAGWKDALEDVLQPPVAAAEVNGRVLGPASAWPPACPLLALGAPRHVLLSLFGVYTSNFPSAEDVDPRPAAQAFVQAVTTQYDAFFVEPSCRSRASKRSAAADSAEDSANPPAPAAPAARRRRASAARDTVGGGGQA